MSCFKECGLDREFSYQQWEWALRILNPVNQAGGHAQVWGVLKDQRTWQPGLTMSFSSLLPPSALRDAYLIERATATLCPQLVTSPRKGTDAQDQISRPPGRPSSPRKGTGTQAQPGRPPGRPSGSFLAHLFSLSFNYS